MTIPAIKSVRGRPAVELAGATGISPAPSGGGGICLIGAEWGDGLNSTSVVDSEYGELPRVPFELDLERWEVLAYDTAGHALAISCVINVLTSDYATNSFIAITGTELPTLSSAAKADSTTLVGWTLANPADTMYRFVLVSHTGSPAKIVLGIRCFAP